MRFKSSVLNIILLGGLLLGAANAIAKDAQSSDKGKLYPWDIESNLYAYGNGEKSREKDSVIKGIRWSICSDMARLTEITAGSVKLAKKHPDEATEKQVKEIFLNDNPVDDGDFQDVINQKALDLAFKMWASYTGEVNNVVIEQAAWDWCIKQDLSHFKDL